MIITKRERMRKREKERERDASVEEQCRDPYPTIMRSAAGYSMYVDDRYDSGSSYVKRLSRRSPLFCTTSAVCVTCRRASDGRVRNPRNHLPRSRHDNPLSSLSQPDFLITFFYNDAFSNRCATQRLKVRPNYAFAIFLK